MTNKEFDELYKRAVEEYEKNNPLTRKEKIVYGCIIIVCISLVLFGFYSFM